MTVLQLKQFYWDLLEEWQTWRTFVRTSLPGPLGQRVRQAYYAKHMRACGAGFVTRENVRIQSPENVSVGDRVFIDRNCYLSTSGGLEIGSDTFIGAGTKIWTNNHNYGDPNTPFVDQGYEYKPVCIEHDVWIGERCFIKPGTIIKAGAVIRPGTVLARSVPPYTIVEGNPSRVVGSRKTRAAGPRTETPRPDGSTR